jgi:putative nucleotidyltransferase with HDIG domain
MNREQAWALLCEYTQSDSLRKHALAVEAAMRAYAARFGEDAALWGLAGLLHDFDYERWPDPPAHTREGAAILRARGVPEEAVGAVLAHADWNLEEFPRDRPIRKALFAVDELCGFITACALVRPTRLEGLEPASVRKKLKTPAFAAAVKREDVAAGAELLGLPLDDHIRNCIAAMRTVAADLGLASPRA